MLKDKIKKIYAFIFSNARKLCQGIAHLAVSWPKAFACVVILLIASYYPLGGMMIEKIDKSTDYEPKIKAEGQSATVETMAYLINREVNEHMWTANLPVFFPSYFLDNMPNYQKGIISALAQTTKAIKGGLECEDDSLLNKKITDAHGLLKYSGDVWLFAPDNKLKIAPSSASQYRKARKYLRDFNNLLAEEDCLWLKNAQNLQKLLNVIKKDMYKSAGKLENQVAEHSSDFVDTQADDLFYFYQGKIYAYMLVLKAWGIDFKQVLVESGQYQNWTKAILALENGVELSPMMVKNGELNSSVSANHLMFLGYYIVRAENLLNRIDDAMKGVQNNAD